MYFVPLQGLQGTVAGQVVGDVKQRSQKNCNALDIWLGMIRKGNDRHGMLGACPAEIHFSGVDLRAGPVFGPTLRAAAVPCPPTLF
jgi:hypothetical protein